MTTFRLKSTDSKIVIIDGNKKKLVNKTAFNNFNENILGLGKIDMPSKQMNSLSVFFDLEGFTDFCKQIDPQLAVPEYLSEFLSWIFEEIRKGLINKDHEDGYETWSDLPFISKYLGDGLLFLWDTEKMNDVKIRNIVGVTYQICQHYKKTFIPKISKSIILPPPKLRCGIARGTIYSVGNGNDFVGPCINMSARLQKLNSLSFCFSRRGIDPNKMSESYKKIFIVKKVEIRGIGLDELVCIDKNEYELLKGEDKKMFKDV